MAVEAAEFKKAMGRFASGVTVVTVEDEGIRSGLTVSAFCSLSLEPPLVLICIDRKVKSHDAIAAAGHFAVNVLAEDQQEVSTRFASRVENKFESVATCPGILGDPIIEGTLATVECRIVDRLPGGDHTIFVGEVERARVGDAGPLLYFTGAYRRVSG